MSETQVQNAVPEGVRAFDQDGREVIVPREQWVNEVLPGMLKQAWDEPEHLYMIIINSLNDGFVAQVTEAASHLYQIDPLPMRGTCVWAIVLIQNSRLVEAEMVLTGFGEQHGEDGTVLVNLAKVYAAKGETQRAQQTLQRALELDPNLEGGLGWYAALARERGGEEAASAALERMRLNPASWRAQLWLARTELDLGNLAAAEVLYAEALARAPRPAPPDLLMQISGDLGGHGHLSHLLAFTAPLFVPEVHGLPIGNNLIKANVDLGNLSAAAAIRQSLAQLNRPDWREALAFWEAEIAKREGVVAGNVPTPAQEVQIGMLRVDGPVWLPPGSPARGIFGVKPADAPSVTFLGGTAEAPEQPGDPETGELLGRLTRSMPLYLAEQTEMRTAASGRAMLPWAVGQEGVRSSGFVVSAARWPEAIAVQAVQQVENRSHYVVTVHLDAEVEPWEASLVFVRSVDGTRIGELSAEFSPQELDQALPGLADEVVELLSALGPESAPPAYVVPPDFKLYLLQLEQLLAVRCIAIEGAPGQPVTGERAILEGVFALSHTASQGVPARLLLIETMGAMQRGRPEIAAEYRARFERLVADEPVALIDAAFANR